MPLMKRAAPFFRGFRPCRARCGGRSVRKGLHHFSGDGAPAGLGVGARMKGLQPFLWEDAPAGLGVGGKDIFYLAF